MELLGKDLEEFIYNLADDVTNPGEMNREKADAIMYCMGREQKRKDEIHEQAKNQVEQIYFWEESQSGKYQKVIDRLSDRLRDYFFNLRVDDPDLKTKSMPNGTLKVRKQQPVLHINDEKRFLENDSGAMTRTIPSYLAPDKKAILKYIKETGDVPEGVSLETRDDKFSVTINTGVKNVG